MSKKTNTHKILKNIIGELDYKVIGFLLLFSTSLSWFADSLLEILKMQFATNLFLEEKLYILTLILPIIVIWILIRIAYKTKMQDFEDATQINQIIFEKDKVLILFLSTFPKNFDNKLLRSKDIKEFENINLAMPLCAIEAHIEKLEYIQVICSKNSLKDFDDFTTIVQNIFAEKNSKFVMNKFQNNLDFEKLDDVQKILEEVYQKSYELVKDEKEIIIDVTGGQKIVSIAGSYYALANDRRFQYVSTTDKKVIQYNNKRVD